jgi:hypothetical protein
MSKGSHFIVESRKEVGSHNCGMFSLHNGYGLLCISVKKPSSCFAASSTGTHIAHTASTNTPPLGYES